jgi:hypothetical protein
MKSLTSLKGALIMALLLFCSALAFAQTQTTPITLTETTGNYQSIGSGININTNDTFNSFPESNLFAATTPSLQPYLNIYYLTVGSVTTSTTTIVDSQIYNTNIFTNQYQGGTYVVGCSAGNNFTTVQVCAGSGSSGTCTGTVTSNTSNSGSGATFVFSPCANGFTVHDTIYVFGPQTPNTTSNLQWVLGTTGTGTVAIDTTDNDTGTIQCVKLSNGSSGTAYLHAATDNQSGLGNLTQVNGTYTASIHTNILAGSGMTLTMQTVRAGTGGVNSTATLSPTGSGWQTTTNTFTATEANNLAVNSLEEIVTLTSAAPNSSVCVYGINVSNNADLADGTTFNRQTITNLTTIMDAQEWRFSWPINNDSMANLLQVETKRTGTNPVSGVNSENSSLGLHDVLANAKALGVKHIWLNIPITFSQTDMVYFVDYLSAASGGSNAAANLRATLGQSAPWTSWFTRIMIEYGNEMWNNSSMQSLPGYSGCGSYGCWNYFPMSIRAATWMKADSNWNSSVMHFAAGIQTSNGADAFNLHAQDTGGAIDVIANHNYMQGTLSSCTPEQLFQSATTEPWADATDPSSAAGVIYTATQGYQFEVYEGQYNWAGGTCTQTQQIGNSSGLGSALTTTLSPALFNKLLGVLDYDQFVLYQNNFQYTGQPDEAVWGFFTGPGGNYNNPRPAAYGMGMYNKCASLGTGYTATPGSPPTLNFTASNSVNAYSAVPLVTTAAYMNGTSRCMVVWNTDYVNPQTISFTGTGSHPTGSVSITTLSSTNTTDNNEGSNAAIVVQPSSSVVTSPSTVTLAAHSMAILQWSTTGGSPTVPTSGFTMAYSFDPQDWLSRKRQNPLR